MITPSGKSDPNSAGFYLGLCSVGGGADRKPGVTTFAEALKDVEAVNNHGEVLTPIETVTFTICSII